MSLHELEQMPAPEMAEWIAEYTLRGETQHDAALVAEAAALRRGQ